MSHTEPEPADSHREGPAAGPEELYTKALGELAETIAPWFFEFGSWVFGGLIGFNLLIMGSLITLGPVDPAVTAATAAFALALPLDVAGLFALRLAQDLQRVGLEDEVVRAVGQVVPAVGALAPPPSAREVQRQRRTGRLLRASFWILALSGVLAVLGMLAVLWHMAWWIAVAFLAMVMISLVICSLAIVAARPHGAAEAREAREQRRRSQEQRRRARDARHGQARAQAPARDGERDERT